MSGPMKTLQIPGKCVILDLMDLTWLDAGCS